MANAVNRGSRQRANLSGLVTQVFYADGERASTPVIQAALRHLDVEVTHFDKAKDCLGCLKTQDCDLLISNAKWPAEDGMRLLAGARCIKPCVPIILLVDHGDIKTAVRAMKGGATDCLEKPPERAQLASAIDSALRGFVPDGIRLERPLSRTEEEVLRLILQGNTTAEVARMLHRSRRTVEVHRSHVMQKLEVAGTVALVRRCAQLGLLADWP
jgi:FixJ family two-component response regulator